MPGARGSLLCLMVMGTFSGDVGFHGSALHPAPDPTSPPSPAASGWVDGGPYQIGEYAADSVVVNFGAELPAGSEDRFHSMTLVGSEGMETITLLRFERVCAELCGSEPEPKCHFVGIYGRGPGLGDGMPLAAFTVGITIHDVQPMGAGRIMDKWTPPERGSESFTRTVFGDSYRWAPDDQGAALFLEREDFGRDFHAPGLALSFCTPREQLPFTILDCTPMAGALYRGEELVMVVADSYEFIELQLKGHLRVEGHGWYLVATRSEVVGSVGLLRETDVAPESAGAYRSTNGRWMYQWQAPTYVDYPRRC